MTSGSVAALSPFGQRLRLWRTHRGFSQLALAHSAGTTARHLSFLETGRSRPQRDMVLRLADALNLPLREINILLQAAGLNPQFAHQPWHAADLAPFREAIATMLAATCHIQHWSSTHTPPSYRSTRPATPCSGPAW